MCGTYSSDKEKKWILDFDMPYTPEFIKQLVAELANTAPYELTLYGVIPTKNGFHFVCSPFNIKDFSMAHTETWKLFELHKNNPTVLYVP